MKENIVNFNRKQLLRLPDLKESVEKPAKRAVQTPDDSILKTGQVASMNVMRDWVQKPEGGLLLLKGYAGTGKTFLLNHFTEWYLSNIRGEKIVLTAPTNKAVKVMFEKSEYFHNNLQYSTIHSLLGLVENIDPYGNVTFKPNPAVLPKVQEYRVLIIDESSMLSDELFDMLMPYVMSEKLKILFAGDPYQIPPVGKDNCIPFIEEEQKAYEIEVTELSEIVRQAEGSPIIELSLQLRQDIHRDRLMVLDGITEPNEDGDGVHVFDRNETADASEFSSLLMETLFCSENFKENADFVKIIAWRNKTVDYMNDWVRKKLFGEACQKIEIGEKLIADKPIFGDHGETILFTSNEEFVVEEFTLANESINEGQYSLKYYDARVGSYTRSGMYVQTKIKILHEDSEVTYDGILTVLASVAKGKPKGSWEAKASWKEFYGFQKMFAPIKYNYAITAHKSQGSTYENTFVIETDINMNRKVFERNRIKYTAITRPSKRLYVLR